jgi:hypothetical protein
MQPSDYGVDFAGHADSATTEKQCDERCQPRCELHGTTWHIATGQAIGQCYRGIGPRNFASSSMRSKRVCRASNPPLPPLNDGISKVKVLDGADAPERWVMTPPDRTLVMAKHHANRLGFSAWPDSNPARPPGKLTARDLRALTPLIWEHVNPYGRFELDMEARLPIS